MQIYMCVCVCLEDVKKRGITSLYLPVSWVCSLATLIPYAPERGRKGREEEEESSSEREGGREKGMKSEGMRGEKREK